MSEKHQKTGTIDVLAQRAAKNTGVFAYKRMPMQLSDTGNTINRCSSKRKKSK